MLVIVLAVLLTLDIIQLSGDWEKHDVSEESLAPEPQVPCFSQPNALCILELASEDGLSKFVHLLNLHKLSVELKAANTEAARKMRTTEKEKAIAWRAERISKQDV